MNDKCICCIKGFEDGQDRHAIRIGEVIYHMHTACLKNRQDIINMDFPDPLLWLKEITESLGSTAYIASRYASKYADVKVPMSKIIQHLSMASVVIIDLLGDIQCQA